MFEKSKKYSLEEVTEKFYLELIKNLPVKIHKRISTTIILKNEKNNLSAEIRFDTAGTSGEYAVIDVKIINILTQEKSNRLRLNITDKKYESSNRIPDLKGGYYWNYDKNFYNYVPRFDLIIDDLVEYFEIMNIV